MFDTQAVTNALMLFLARLHQEDPPGTIEVVQLADGIGESENLQGVATLCTSLGQSGLIHCDGGPMGFVRISDLGLQQVMKGSSG